MGGKEQHTAVSDTMMVTARVQGRLGKNRGNFGSKVCFSKYKINSLCTITRFTNEKVLNELHACGSQGNSLNAF